MLDPKVSRHLGLLKRYSVQLVELVEANGITVETLGVDLMQQLAVTKAIELVGEEASKLLSLGVDLGPDIPLKAIAGMRHRIVHDYDGISWDAVNEVVFLDMPTLVERLAILDDSSVVIAPRA